MPVDCHLLIPALFIDALKGAEYRDLRTPALQILLALADMRPAIADRYHEWLAKRFGMSMGENIPVAPITASDDGHEPGKNFWLRADPVHLRIQRDQIVLFDARIAPLKQDEADSLCNSLNLHFAHDGLQFIAAVSDRWYLKLDAGPALSTTILDLACGKNIETLMPWGTDSHLWRQRMNEIQMLLFEHPVNAAREARRELPINSVWFWGGGFMPQNVRGDFTQVFCDEIFSCGLVRAAKISLQPLPQNFQKISEAISKQAFTNNKILIIIKYLCCSMLYADINKWRTSLEQLEDDWFAPLLHALKSGAINSVTITATDVNRPKDFVITRNSLRKFWRRVKPIANYA
ncbi:MAG: hypothetical protein WCD07_10815 [Burkholderiales bacterium]